uniref:Uncharacterized protein n=1 Tax=Anguilla anguilla TaxID=7936 RepID=A0A0E9RAE7_ANGAN
MHFICEKCSVHSLKNVSLTSERHRYSAILNVLRRLACSISKHQATASLYVSGVWSQLTL